MKHYITILAAISAIASFGAVNVQTAKLSTLPGKTMVVTNITGAASVSDIPTDSTISGWGYIKSWTETDPTVPSWAKATSKPSYTWNEIGSKPTTFPPSAHSHAQRDVTGLTAELAGKRGMTDLSYARTSWKWDDEWKFPDGYQIPESWGDGWYTKTYTDQYGQPYGFDIFLADETYIGSGTVDHNEEHFVACSQVGGDPAYGPFPEFATKNETEVTTTDTLALTSDIRAALSDKQDVIADLNTIRSGAALGATALQSYTETDPTVPSWAKSTSKPTYGWEEITNTPTAFPNPNALSFYSKSGILIFSYDGREAKSVIMEDMGDMGDMGGAEFLAWRDSKNPYLGKNSHSTGEDYSVALGVGAEASGTHSVALGAGGVRAAAMHALAVGNSVEARAIASTAIGYSSFANAQSSTAIGGNAYANGERSHAAGWAAIADALNSTAVGNAARVHTGSVGATAIGSGATVGPNATNAVQIGFGTNDDPETLQFMGRKVLLDDLDYAKYEVVTNDYGEEWVYFCGLPGWTVTPPTWDSSESRWQSYFTDPIEGTPWLTDWSDPDAKGYDATLLTIDGYKSVAYRGIHMVTNLVHSRIATTNDLSHANPVFSNEVLAVSLELFDTNTVAVLNDLAGTVDGIPLEGGAASIGTILLALLAAVAWLKKNKIGANDVKRVYNVNGTQYIDGDGGVYKADVELGGHWTLKQLNYTYIAKYKGRREVAGNPYYWVTDDGNRYIYYTPETGKISINGNRATPSAPVNLNPEHGDDFPGTFSYSNWTAVFTKQQSVFPSEPQDKIAKKSELDGKVGKELSGQTFDMSNDVDTKRLLTLVGQALGATVTHTPLE